MSIDLSNLDKEAFNISITPSKFTFERRAFPPRFDPSQDTGNTKEKTIFLSSIVNLSSDFRVPLTLSGGVTGSVWGVCVQALCFTDYILGRQLDFNTMVSSFIGIKDFKGKEVVGGVAFLTSGEVEEVTCVKGVLSGVKAKTLRIGAAAVLHNCEIEEVLFDPQLCYQFLCSRSTVLGKNLEIAVSFFAVAVHAPMVQLVSTKAPNSVAQEIRITTKESIDNISRLEEYFTKVISDMHTVKKALETDRGSFWQFDDRADFVINPQECPICLLSLPEQVIGHHAGARDEPHLLHAFCYACFEEMRNRLAQETSNNSKTPCPICRLEIKNISPQMFGRRNRLTCGLEGDYGDLMGLTDLLKIAQSVWKI